MCSVGERKGRQRTVLSVAEGDIEVYTTLWIIFDFYKGRLRESATPIPIQIISLASVYVIFVI